MTTKDAPNPTESLGDTTLIPTSEMFRVIAEQATDIVSIALHHRQAASEGARSALKAAIDRSDIAIPGFRSPSRARADVLTQPVLIEILYGDDRLASAVLRMWAEALSGLAELVTAHLDSSGIPVVRARKETFEATWPYSESFMESGMLTAEHPEFNRRDVALMLCYLSGRFPVEQHFQSDLFKRFLQELEALPSDAPEWDEALGFLTELTTTVAEGVAERSLAQKEEFDAAIAAITVEFADELRYLSMDIVALSSGVVGVSLIRPALAFADSLRSALDAYRELRPQAPTRSEEKERAEQRERCEVQLLAILDEWQQSVDAASAESSVDGEAGRGADAVTEEASLQIEATVSAGEEVTTENSRLKWANDALREDRNRLQAEKQAVTVENARLIKELGALRHAHDRLRTEKDAQSEENSTLKRQLRESRQREEAWRGAPPVTRPAGEEPVGPPPVESVSEAIAAAAARFPDRLVIAFNSRSRQDTPFQRPDEVLTALSWLAADYYRIRSDGGGDAADLDKAIKEVCPGWSYIPHQSAVTIGKFKDWYYTSVNGTKYELAEHLGKGSSGNPQHTIRVAFAWDDDEKKVIVGYIGHHQRSQGS